MVKSKKDLILKIFVSLFLLWIAISIVRTFYNLSKLVTEERQWYSLSDEDKRAKQFGDLHYFFRFVQQHTKRGSTILFSTSDPKAYYLGRYYIYPTLAYWLEMDGVNWTKQKRYYDYYMIYPVSKRSIDKIKLPDAVKGYNQFAVYNKGKNNIGVLFKK